jgi:hypothetical protein
MQEEAAEVTPTYCGEDKWNPWTCSSQCRPHHDSVALDLTDANPCGTPWQAMKCGPLFQASDSGSSSGGHTALRH